LVTANIELEFQNTEKEKRARELSIANKELLFQNSEKQKRSDELIIANRELLYQNEEKEKRAAELAIANIELAFQNEEKEKANQLRIISEGKLARAKKLAKMGSWELDFSTNTLQLSKEATRIFGFPEGEGLLSFEVWTSVIHPDDLQLVLDEVNDARSTLRDVSFHYRIIRPDNGIRHIYSECKFDTDNTSHAMGLYGFAQDVTETKLAEEQKEFERTNLASLINNTEDLIWSTDCDFKLITSNQAFISLAKSVTGKLFTKGSHVLTLEPDEDKLFLHKSFYERAFAGESFTEIEYTKSPDESWSEISYYPIRKGKEIIGTACYSRNITERKKAEQEREKMSNDIILRSKNLEQFAYIISHNLRAPVAHIMGLANLLHATLSETDRIKTQDYLFDAVNQMDLVIRDLHKILATKSEITENKELVNFNSLVVDIKAGIASLIKKEDVRILTDFSALKEISSIKSYMHSIFYNLIVNSIKYRGKCEKPSIKIKSELKNDNLKISFSDNGTGIDLHKHGHHLFGLYKRFHLEVDGKGVGLFMVKTQVESLGGTITVKSEAGKGAEFIVTLPVMQKL